VVGLCKFIRWVEPKTDKCIQKCYTVFKHAMTQFLVLCYWGRAGLDGHTSDTLWKSSAPLPAYVIMLGCVHSPWELVEMAKNRGFSRGFVPKRGVMIAKSGGCGTR
jgi:hypothetical protein